MVGKNNRTTAAHGGTVFGGRQLILPVAKSTEIMFVNETAFNRYAEVSGASLSDLETWEGIFRLAEDYTRWTDEQTPDIPEDGKPFFCP